MESDPGLGDGSREVGAVAVEFALLFPLFLLLVFGAIDLGGLFRDSNLLQSASAHGARAASVLARQEQFASDAKNTVAAELRRAGVQGSRIIVFKADRETGRPIDVSADEPFSSCTLCDVWDWVPGSGTWEKTDTEWPSNTQTACGRLVDGTDTSDYVGVYVSTIFEPITGISKPILGSSRRIARSTIMRLEPTGDVNQPC